MFKRFFSNESGSTALEYCLIAGLIVIAIVGGVTTLGTSANDSLGTAAAAIVA